MHQVHSTRTHDNLRDRHRQPDSGLPHQERQEKDEAAAYDDSPCDGDSKGSTRLHDGLEVVGGKHVQQQKDKGKRIQADNPGRNFQHLRRSIHQGTDDLPGEAHGNGYQNSGKAVSGKYSVPERLPDPAILPSSIAAGKDRLRRLATLYP